MVTLVALMLRDFYNTPKRIIKIVSSFVGLRMMAWGRAK